MKESCLNDRDVITLSKVLERLLLEDLDDWEKIIANLEQRNLNLKVPLENTKTTLHHFNCQLNELYTEVQYYFARARRNKDAIERLIDNVLKDHYKGGNDRERRAAGIQFAQKYPAPVGFYPETVDLFYLEDKFKWFYYSLESIIQSLNAKAGAKITNNSLLKIDELVTRYA
jgi:hypothetical protein